MFRKDHKYYFVLLECGWIGPNYSVTDSLFGPFERIGIILQQNPTVATGAGHHSVIHIPKSDKWYIVYHRRLSKQTAITGGRVLMKCTLMEKGLLKPFPVVSKART